MAADQTTLRIDASRLQRVTQAYQAIVAQTRRQVRTLRAVVRERVNLGLGAVRRSSIFDRASPGAEVVGAIGRRSSGSAKESKFLRSLARPLATLLGAETAKQVATDVLAGATGREILKRQLNLIVPELIREPVEALVRAQASQLEQQVLSQVNRLLEAGDLKQRLKNEPFLLQQAVRVAEQDFLRRQREERERLRSGDKLSSGSDG